MPSWYTMCSQAESLCGDSRVVRRLKAYAGTRELSVCLSVSLCIHERATTEDSTRKVTSPTYHMILNHTYVIIRAREWVIQSTQNYSCIHLDDSERHFIRHEYLLADAIAGTPTRIFTGRMWSYSLRSSNTRCNRQWTMSGPFSMLKIF